MSTPMENRIKRAIHEALKEVAHDRGDTKILGLEAGTVAATHAVVELLGLDLPTSDTYAEASRLIATLEQTVIAAEELQEAIRHNGVTEFFSRKARPANSCGKCDWTGSDEELADQLQEIIDLANKLAPGGTVPAGTCPMCKALAYPVEEGAQS